jgi:hypothetical protein
MPLPEAAALLRIRPRPRPVSDSPPIFDAPRTFPESNAAMRQSDSPVAGNLAPFARCHVWLSPEVLEARQRPTPWHGHSRRAHPLALWEMISATPKP